MKFIHEDADFDALLRIVAEKREIAVALVEKDYWVTHVLWALHDQGFDIWFKGGTSLSKGFSIIQRFSEDLDLKVEAGSVAGMPKVSSWRSANKGAIAGRQDYFSSLTEIIRVPGASVELDSDAAHEKWHGAPIQVRYPNRHTASLPDDMTPFVLLDVGDARVTPFVRRDLSSFVHDHLDEQKQARSFVANRPRNVRCVHPLVTLIEKLDALMRRAANSRVEPAKFVRHYEDAAQIIAIAGESQLPALDGYDGPRPLVAEMLRQRDIRALPSADNDAFRLSGHPRERAIRAADDRIQHMFWGPRISLDDSCTAIRTWVRGTMS